MTNSRFSLLSVLFAMTIPSVGLAHTEGLVADRERPKFERCVREAKAEAQYSGTWQFLQAVFQNMYDQNKDSQVHAANEYCIKITVKFGFKPNAFSVVETGEIDFTPSIMKLFASEEEVAAIMAHEMAHISMYHADPIPFELRATLSRETVDVLRDILKKSEELSGARENRQIMVDMLLSKVRKSIEAEKDSAKRKAAATILAKHDELQKLPVASSNYKYHPLFTSDEHYQQLIDLAATYGADVRSARDHHMTAATVLSEISNMESQVKREIGSKYRSEMLTNFGEREADEVGLELFVRAGYNPQKFVDAHFALMDMLDDKLTSREQARKLCADKAKLGQLDPGKNSHPDICWRVENIKRELTRHKAYYDDLSAKARKRNTGPSLSQIKAEL